MNERIKKLREQSLNAVNRVCPERARLITQFYQSPTAREVSVPMQRALAFKYLMENKTICINPGELIVGERGRGPKATPAYPEVCIHSMDDLNILDSRPKVPFSVDRETREVFKNEIIPFWQGKSLRERIFHQLPPEWKDAYKAGVFTEFLEQRSPGHTVLGGKIYHKGLLDLKKEIQHRLERLNFYDDSDALDKKEQLEAMAVAADAVIIFAHRHADALNQMAAAETGELRKKELLEMEEICRNVPANAPRNFHEALQGYWFIHQGVVSELNPWDSFNPGRLDQHLHPFYKSGLEQGTLTEERARELLQSFWVKFNNHPAPPKVGITAKESNTYTDFCLINVGGVTEDGADASNELSYLLLDVIEEMRLLQPSSMVQVSKKNPDRLLKRALKIIKTGFGQPSIFNTDAIIQELTRQGKSLEDARRGGASGCVEAGAFGVEAYILTGYFNLAKILELTLNNGTDPNTGRLLGIETGDARNFKTFGQLMTAYRRQLEHFIDIKIKGNNIIGCAWGKYMPVPFLSLLIDDCIENGKDYNDGGARYNTRYIQGVGIGSTTDSLAAIKHHVFHRNTFTMDQLIKAIDNDFGGYDDLRDKLLNDSPKYGNDNDDADTIMKDVFNLFYNAVEGRPAGRQGEHHIMMLPTTAHAYFGSVIGALPDGRKAKEPLSEGISPVQGADRSGPTSVIKSAAKMDHLRTGGTLLNQKFTPQILGTDSGINRLLSLIRSYFRMDGHHMQFNVIDADTLRKAKKYPDQYRSLIVRVAGYSDYFIDLTEELQDEIIHRTEHQSF